MAGKKREIHSCNSSCGIVCENDNLKKENQELRNQLEVYKEALNEAGIELEVYKSILAEACQELEYEQRLTYCRDPWTRDKWLEYFETNRKNDLEEARENLKGDTNGEN